MFVMQAFLLQTSYKCHLPLLHKISPFSPQSLPTKALPFPRPSLPMADRDLHLRGQTQRQIGTGGISKSKILAVVIVLPLGGVLLLVSGMTLAGTLICLALTFPLFMIFSPVLVPAALTVALSIVGFMASGAFGVSALSSLSWIVNYLRQGRGGVDPMKQDTVGYMGQKTQQAIRT